MPRKTETAHPRPWIDHYPEGVRWDDEIDLTPVHERLLEICQRTPDAVALDFLGKKTRFRELGRDIERFAAALQSQFSVTKGTRVALLLPNTPFYVIAYYAILRAGGTVVNCNPLYTVPELAHIVGNSGASVMVTLDLKQLFDKAERLVADGQVKSLVVCHFPDALPILKRNLFKLAKRKDLAHVSASPIADRTAKFSDMIDRDGALVPVRLDPLKDVAVQQYTGGTTGLPKGAMLSHANIAANMSQIDKWGLGLFDPPTRVVAVLPFFHIFAMTACMNVPLCSGAQVVMLPRFEMKALLDLLTRTGANVMPAVPTLIHALGRAGPSAVSALSSLKVVVSGGAPLSDETRTLFARVSPALLAEGYGLTEASPVVCCAALRVPSKPRSIGQPLPGTDIRFVDIETGEPAALGERGELQVKGPQVMLGYYDDPEADLEAFADGWLRTGDVGLLDEDGYVFLVDRIKDLIITSGFNVYPRTIEEAIYGHEAVDEVTVIGVPDTYRGEAPVAFVKLKAETSANEADIKAFIADKLNKLEMPREIIFRSELPKTLIGKLSKKELREEYAQRKGSKSEQG
ncbi:long-chain fatty acid--CoA ligase [Arsenicitalea aurantiaca]|uniref:Long-chain fatty acid--CoA ligase n=1 Tax=Arsenicitalea aurantiaca TaxID=1783274 RepID=A0A433XGK5_9HYPH|nr:long-chain fatty acid--CoA ligase [Arsenicitalea aurantiaca]RUT33078.1 long-chain fatty acid--CoA ligase [Arsenicitalea aurantiaca]